MYLTVIENYPPNGRDPRSIFRPGRNIAGFASWTNAGCDPQSAGARASRAVSSGGNQRSS
jgi:hypothetical protein